MTIRRSHGSGGRRGAPRCFTGSINTTRSWAAFVRIAHRDRFQQRRQFGDGESRGFADQRVTSWAAQVLAAVVNLTVVAGENLTVGSTTWLPAASVAPGR